MCIKHILWYVGFVASLTSVPVTGEFSAGTAPGCVPRKTLMRLPGAIRPWPAKNRKQNLRRDGHDTSTGERAMAAKSKNT